MFDAERQLTLNTSRKRTIPAQRTGYPPPGLNFRPKHTLLLYERAAAAAETGSTIDRGPATPDDSVMGAVPARSDQDFAGSCTMNVEPRPTSLSTVHRPPSAARCDWTRNNPSPRCPSAAAPWAASPRKNGSNRCGTWLGGMP